MIIQNVPTIIFDIDGTLANIEHRIHFIKNKPKNWTKFFENMEYDTQILATCDLCSHLINSVWHNVVFCTGRNEKYRVVTLKWLQTRVHWDISNEQLYMRPDNVNRHDYIVKEELLQKIREDGYNPVSVFEDRQQCVDMWRRNGLVCYQVDEGNF